MMEVFFKFFEIKRLYKRIITSFADISFIVFAYFLAFFVRVGIGETEQWIEGEHLIALLLTSIGSLALWIKLGLYRAIIRYIDVKVLSNLAIGSIMSAAILLVSSYLLNAGMPRSIPFIYFTIILIFTAGSRLFIRGLINSRTHNYSESVIIYGAGASGRQLCLSLQHGSEYTPVAFIDADVHLKGSFVVGVKVYEPEKLKSLVEQFNIQKVLLAIPSASLKQRKFIIRSVEELKIKMLTIPGSADLISGKVSVSQLRDVGIKDLLGRESIPPKNGLLEECIECNNVLVTGGGGSIGSELCRTICRLKPKRLLVLDISEFNLYSIEQELNGLHGNIEILPILGSVLNKKLVNDIVSKYEIDTIYHAAAYKHVPLVEMNSSNGLENNVIGTQIVANAALKNKVGHFVLISTDKAVRPTNVMGASKRLAELVVQELATRSSGTVFCMVRFGNVLGSSGSVVPLFKKQIESGGPVTVTHPEITRYFMTIPEAASLVIQAGAMAKGGEVFVLDMGKPVKIRDLAENMINLMGLDVKSEVNPDGQIEIHYSGLRPGEKLYEELLIGNEVEGTENPRIMKAREIALPMTRLSSVLASIELCILNGNMSGLREVLMNASLGFSPVSEIADLLFLQEGAFKSGEKCEFPKDHSNVAPIKIN